MNPRIFIVRSQQIATFAVLALGSLIVFSQSAGGQRSTPGSSEDLARNVGDSVYFAANSFDIKGDGRKTLREQAKWLGHYPDRLVVIEGHADRSETDPIVGKRRALAVKQVLIKEGVAADRIFLIDHSARRPAVDGNDAAAFVKNRRAVTAVLNGNEWNLLQDLIEQWRRSPYDPEAVYALARPYAALPGLELPALILFHLYVAVAPNGPNSLEARTQIQRLDHAAESRILTYVDMAEHTAVILPEGERRANARFAVAQMLIAAGDTDKALLIIRSLDMKAGLSQDTIDDRLVATSEIALEAGYPDTSRELMDLIVTAPYRALVRIRLAAYLLSTGDRANAARMLEQALSFVPSTSDERLISTIWSEAIVLKGELGEITGAKVLLSSTRVREIWFKEQSYVSRSSLEPAANVSRSSLEDATTALTALASAQHKAGQGKAEAETLEKLKKMITSRSKAEMVGLLHGVVRYLSLANDQPSAKSFVELANSNGLASDEFGFTTQDVEIEVAAAHDSPQEVVQRFADLLKTHPKFALDDELIGSIAQKLAARENPESVLALMALDRVHGPLITKRVFDSYARNLSLSYQRSDAVALWYSITNIVLSQGDYLINRLPEGYLREQIGKSPPDDNPFLIAVTATEMGVTLKEIRSFTQPSSNPLGRDQTSASIVATPESFMRMGIEAAQVSEWGLAYSYMLEAARNTPGRTQPICNLGVAADQAGDDLLAFAAYTACTHASPDGATKSGTLQRRKAVAEEIGQWLNGVMAEMDGLKAKSGRVKMSESREVQLNLLKKWDQHLRGQLTSLVEEKSNQSSEVWLPELQSLVDQRDLIRTRSTPLRRIEDLSPEQIEAEVHALDRTLSAIQDVADRLQYDDFIDKEFGLVPPAAGSTKVNPKDGLIYVWIPPGTFQMGCTPGDNNCSIVEKPTHSVTITKGFWLGQTPVTQEAYRHIKGINPSQFSGAQRPVEMVSWDDAVAYCSEAGMRLPTEAEWEYATRAGSTTSRYGTTDAIAWYRANSGFATHKVAQKEPNAWKLYDMLGNVNEWTADWFDESYYGQSPSEDPVGPSSGNWRVLRGASWAEDARSARASVRDFTNADRRYNTVGFRCAGDDLP